MTTAYLTGLTDEGLQDHLNDTLREVERRGRLANVPSQIAAMTAQYVADGGDVEAVKEAVSNVGAPAPEAPVEEEPPTDG